MLEYPQYTRPEEFRGMRVPEILLGGDTERSAPGARTKREGAPNAAVPDSFPGATSDVRSFVALIHYPVLDRNGRIVTSAITSLDLHDISRCAYIRICAASTCVHPAADQRRICDRLLDHWRLDHGRLYDSRRREALDLVETVADFEGAIKAAEAIAGARPQAVYTSARSTEGLSYSELRARLDSAGGPPMMLMLGTGFGLAPAMRERADLILTVHGPDEYNHLSVRAAAAVILDRLRGR